MSTLGFEGHNRLRMSKRGRLTTQENKNLLSVKSKHGKQQISDHLLYGLAWKPTGYGYCVLSLPRKVAAAWERFPTGRLAPVDSVPLYVWHATNLSCQAEEICFAGLGSDLRRKAPSSLPQLFPIHEVRTGLFQGICRSNPLISHGQKWNLGDPPPTVACQ